MGAAFIYLSPRERNLSREGFNNLLNLFVNNAGVTAEKANFRKGIAPRPGFFHRACSSSTVPP